MVRHAQPLPVDCRLRVNRARHEYYVVWIMAPESNAFRGDCGFRSSGLRARPAHSPGLQRLRDARYGIPNEPEPSRLVRHRQADEASVVRGRVRRGWQFLRGRAAKPVRSQELHAHRGGRAAHDLRVRAVRHGCRRRPDDVPSAARLGRARQVRRRPDLEPVHGPRRVPELGRILGPQRHGVLSQRAIALHAAGKRTAAPASWSRSSGPARAPTKASTPIASSWQGVDANFPMPDISAHFRSAGDWGHFQVAGILRQIEWEDVTPARPHRSQRRRASGGAST